MVTEIGGNVCIGHWLAPAKGRAGRHGTHDLCRVAQPRVAAVVIALAAEHLRQPGGRGRGYRAGRLKHHDHIPHGSASWNLSHCSNSMPAPRCTQRIRSGHDQFALAASERSPLAPLPPERERANKLAPNLCSALREAGRG